MCDFWIYKLPTCFYNVVNINGSNLITYRYTLGEKFILCRSTRLRARRGRLVAYPIIKDRAGQGSKGGFRTRLYIIEDARQLYGTYQRALHCLSHLFLARIGVVVKHSFD